MPRHIGVRMPGQPMRMGHFDAAERHKAAFRKPVRIKASPNAGEKLRGEQARHAVKILWPSNLLKQWAACNHLDGGTMCFGNRHIVQEHLIGRDCLIGGLDQARFEGLWGLDAHKAVAGLGLFNLAIWGPPQSVSNRETRRCAIGPGL